MTEVLSAPHQQHASSSPSPSSSYMLPQQQDKDKSVSGTSPTTSRASRQNHHRDEQQSLSQDGAMSQPQSESSQYSVELPDRSRPHSQALLPVQSSLSYAMVRDFAYPQYHPMHFGGSPEEPSGASTPSDWNTGRRASESAEANTHGGKWPSAGPWGGDGVLYGDPDQDMEPLPSTAFGSGSESSLDGWEEGETSFSSSKSKHRKSRSFHDIQTQERGRRRESQRMSRGHDENQQPASQYDPAGRNALRQSRGFAAAENGEVPSQAQSGRRDSRFATTLPNRSFHTSPPIDPDSDLPLDAEPSDHHSPQRESMGPEDEELFAGPSLALYGFEPENENELPLAEGEVIMVSYRHGQGWLVAEKETGEQGLVPEAYVRLLKDIEGWDEERGQFIDEVEYGDTEEVTTPTGTGSSTMSTQKDA